MHEKIPVSLYIHLPWCIQKCPYCDFNSHAVKNDLPEALYVNALIDNWERQVPWLQNRPLRSIFFGGGTPSLFSAQAIEKILSTISSHTPLPDEITLEANPGTIDQDRFDGFYKAGITRLSLGVQSLQDDKLKTLGRIHNSDQVLRAMDAARKAGFDNINVDLMYGLPQQTIHDALHDLEKAWALQPTHLSWYQLTLEPNTLFYKQPPPLPPDDTIWEMQQHGQQYLNAIGFQQYEVSAYTQPQRECNHNLNYWEFGDYLGIGAGAHGKLTDATSGAIFRCAQVKHPRDFLDSNKRQAVLPQPVPTKDLTFEFMLNILRLTEGVPASLFAERTCIPLQQIESQIHAASQRGLMIEDPQHLRATPLGFRFLNDLVGMFL